MSIWGKLFGSEKVIEGAYNGIDKAFFTDEEKAELWIKILQAYEAFKIAQRYLALILSIPFAATHVLAVFVFCISLAFDPCSAEAVCKSSQLSDGAVSIMTWNNEQLGFPVSLILGFYFGGGMIEGGINALRKRKEKSQ